MSYRYEEHRPFVFTEEGQKVFLCVLSFARNAINKTGAVTGGKLLGAAGSGESWSLMACYDRLVELGYLRRIKQAESYVAGQDEVYVAGSKAFP